MSNGVQAAAMSVKVTMSLNSTVTSANFSENDVVNDQGFSLDKWSNVYLPV